MSDDLDLHEDVENDAIIGRAFKGSMLVLGVLAVLAIVAWLLLREGPQIEQAVDKQVGDVADRAAATESMPEVRFTDVTAEWGIDFVHEDRARGEKLLPETMGGGVGVLDYDADGDGDLVFVDSKQDGPALRLYRNDGGAFTETTREAGLDARRFGMGVAIGDYDNDGDPDLLLTALGPNVLYRNDGGRFVDVTSAAGVAGEDERWSSSAGFFDYDLDGDLDLFVVNYVRWTREIDLELAFSINGTDRAYGPPTNYEGTFSYLYRNEGDGRFRDVSAEAGIQVVSPVNDRPMGKGLALAIVDYDEDGYPDVVVANDTVQNFLFHNLGDGRFEELGAISGVGFGSNGEATGAMGIDVAHHRNDAMLAVGVGNFANEMSSLYVTRPGTGQFTDEAIGEGVGAPSRLALSFGLFFFDYDLDGRLDLLQANGHLESEIEQVQASQRYEQPAQLFWNQGPEARACFVEVPGAELGDLSRPIVGRGATYGDLDGDGDLDVVLTQVGGPPLVLRNDQALDHEWMRLKLVGSDSNRDAIGAWVTVEVDGVEQRRQVMPTRSYLSQVETTLTFGLGAGEAADRIEVRWPDGSVQPVEPPPVGQESLVIQGKTEG